MTEAVSSETLKARRGEVLRAARKRAALSARRLADRINDRTAGSDLTENAIYAYESGRVLLSRETAERIAAVLRLPLGELLVGDPDFTDSNDPARFGERDAATDTTDAGPQRWRTACRALAPLGRELERSAEVLARQLAVPRFELDSPRRFAASFELVATDAQTLRQHPEAAHVELQDPDAWYERPQSLLAAAKAVQDAAEEAHRDLTEAARSVGNCGPACRDAAETVRGAWDALLTALGPVEQAAGEARDASA